MARDKQKARVYALDRRMMYAATFHEPMHYRDGMTVPEMQNITAKLWAGLGMGSVPLVRDGRRCRSALGDARGVQIPRWARNSVILCHELAHTYIHRLATGGLYAPHGPEYMAVYVEFLLTLNLLSLGEIENLAKSEGVEIDKEFHRAPGFDHLEIA